MAQILVRNIETDVHHRLRELATARGISMEEFLRDALRSVAFQTADTPISFAAQMKEIFGDVGLREDECIPELKGEAVRVPTFD